MCIPNTLTSPCRQLQINVFKFAHEQVDSQTGNQRDRRTERSQRICYSIIQPCYGALKINMSKTRWTDRKVDVPSLIIINLLLDNIILIKTKTKTLPDRRENRWYKWKKKWSFYYIWNEQNCPQTYRHKHVHHQSKWPYVNEYKLYTYFYLILK